MNFTKSRYGSRLMDDHMSSSLLRVSTSDMKLDGFAKRGDVSAAPIRLNHMFSFINTLKLLFILVG